MDVTLYIIQGGVVRLVLLGLVEKIEEPACVLSAGDIVVDQTDQEALAARELGESLLEIFL